MKKLVLVSTLLLSTCISLAQGITSHQIDSLVASAFDIAPHAGVAIVVVKDGKIIHEKGYGYTSLETKELVNEHTRFGIASNSKAFTATALAMLVDEGKLKWTDKVIDYIPEFKAYNDFVTADFTITDLLCHRSGLGLGAGDLMWFPDGNDYTVEEIMKNFQYQTPESDFRTAYAYNNLMFVVAGEVVARVSGMSWCDFIENRIMQPLGMNESAGKHQRLANQSNVAVPHSFINGKLVPIEPMNITEGEAAAGIYASVHDLAQWMILNMNDGMYQESEIVSKENHDIVWTPHIVNNFNVIPKGHYNSQFSSYGLGWSIDDFNGYTVVGHGGGLPGMLSKTRMVPELGLGVIVLTNAAPGNYSYEMLSRSIIDHYVGVEPIDWISIAKNVVDGNQAEEDSILTAVWDKVAPLNKEQINAIVGTYNDPWYGAVEITNKGKSCYWKSVRSPKLSGEVFFYEDNTFVVKWDYVDMECNAFATFKMGTDGKATQIAVEGISPFIDFSFDFQDLRLERAE